jgi:hypothetical protein
MKNKEQPNEKDARNTEGESGFLPEPDPIKNSGKEKQQKPTQPKKTEPSNPPNLKTYGDYRSSGEPKVSAPPKPERDTGSLLGQIKSKVGDALGSDDKEKDKSKSDGPPKKKLNKKEQRDFQDMAQMILSPFLIIAVGQTLGEVCAPTPEEANQFVEPLSRIIARHVPMPEHVSADLIDIMSMASVVIVWYGRVRNDLPWNDDRGGGGGGGRSGRTPRGPRGDGRAREDIDLSTDGVEEFLNDYQ